MKNSSRERRPSDADYARAQRQLRRMIENGVPLKTLAHELAVPASTLRSWYRDVTKRPRPIDLPGNITLYYTDFYMDPDYRQIIYSFREEHDAGRGASGAPEQGGSIPTLEQVDSDPQDSDTTPPRAESPNVSELESEDPTIQTPGDGDHIPILRYELYQHSHEKLVVLAEQFMERFRESGTRLTEARIKGHEHIYNLTVDLCDEVSLRRSEYYRSEFIDLKKKYSTDLSVSEATIMLFLGVTKDRILEKTETHMHEITQDEQDNFLRRCDEVKSVISDSIALSAQTIKDEFDKRKTTEELLDFVNEVFVDFDETLGFEGFSTDLQTVAPKLHEAEGQCTAFIHASFALPELDRVLRRLKCGKGKIETDLSPEAVWELMLNNKIKPEGVTKRRKGRR